MGSFTILTGNHGIFIKVCKDCQYVPEYCLCKNCKCGEEIKKAKMGMKR